MYTIEFNPAANLSAKDKIVMITGQLLIDYMLFAGQTKKCDSDENFIYCYLFYCLCIGALVPCTLCIPKKFD